MDIEALINDPDLKAQINEIKTKIQQSEHAISDVLDENGNQYVDLVMEGGGMLGIALVGYTWALEEMGIRFLGIGGTSAGSINALLLAAMNDPAEKKSPQLLEAMGNLDFYRFVDGDGTDKGRRNTRALIELALDGEPIRFWKGLKLFKAYWSVRKHLIRTYGLNQGEAFRNWLTDLLGTADIRTTADLRARMQRIPDLKIRAGRVMPAGWKPEPGELVIISSDITTETRVEFPDMAELYWKHVDNLNPANYARASMSIPYFFETYRVTDLPDTPEVRQRWSKVGLDWKNENGDKIPEHILFVDGGITSNFPIDAFHDLSKVPSRPTFGVKLQYDNRYKPPSKLPLTGGGSRTPLMSLTGAMFNSARHTLDYEFIKKNPDYQNLVQFIPCTYKDPDSGQLKSYNWLDFKMSREHREGLFRQGAQKAIEFVSEFSEKWDDYKTLRDELKTG
jgi:NTE family protein